MLSELEQYRYEKKFVIDKSVHFLINNCVKNNRLLFKSNFPKRTINTIYFDDNLELYYQNINGLKNRKKVRIRWYGDKSDFLLPILELKMKNGNLGKKIRLPLNTICQKNKKVSLKEIINSLLETNLPIKFKELIYNYKPNLFISYEREYFLSQITDCRLTIDQNIKYHKISCNKINDISKNYCNSIIEVKYPANLESTILEGILDIPFRTSKHSKYVEGINLIY